MTPLRIGRSIGAILGGFVAVVILSLGTDMAMHAAGIFPPWGEPMADSLFLLAAAYRTVYAIAGSYITARLAPNRPMQHALLGGALGFAASAIGAATTWDKGPAFGPHWYPLWLAVTAMPCAWVGGRLFDAQSHPQPRAR
jgi:hypothetical protein